KWIATAAPWRAKPLATPAPMPELAPVTSTPLPARSSSIFLRLPRVKCDAKPDGAKGGVCGKAPPGDAIALCPGDGVDGRSLCARRAPARRDQRDPGSDDARAWPPSRPGARRSVQDAAAGAAAGQYGAAHLAGAHRRPSRLLCGGRADAP